MSINVMSERFKAAQMCQTCIEDLDKVSKAMQGHIDAANLGTRECKSLIYTVRAGLDYIEAKLSKIEERS